MYVVTTIIHVLLTDRLSVCLSGMDVVGVLPILFFFFRLDIRRRNHHHSRLFRTDIGRKDCMARTARSAHHMELWSADSHSAK